MYDLNSPLQAFKDVLNTFTEKVKHPEKDSLLLEDIFVYPHVKKLNNNEIYDSSKIYRSENCMVFIGSEYSGKTSLSNKTALDLLSDGYGIVKLNGRDIKEANAEKLFYKQKSKNKYFHENTHNGKKVLVVDDIHDIGLNDRHLEIFFVSSIDFYDFVIFFCSERDYFANSIYSENSDIECYRIQDFGFRKRDEIYFKWLSVGNPNIQTIGNDDYHQSLDVLSSRVESVIGNNVV